MKYKSCFELFYQIIFTSEEMYDFDQKMGKIKEGKE